jgi:adenosylmethionine-8-amino-7-oxononanoate aminotransferase
VARALTEQASQLVHGSAGFFNTTQVRLCSTLAHESGLGRVFLCSTGAEANESAIKLARKWGQLARGGAWEIVTTTDAFHGRTLATMSASGKATFAPLFEPKVQGFRKVPFGDADAIEAVLDDHVAAVLVEPIQGEAGVVMPPPGYLKRLRELTAARGVLLMFDEVQTGIGRTGKLFAFQHEDARPDVLTLGKGLGAGVPLAAMLCDARYACFQPGDQGGTYSGNALTAAVGQAVMDAVMAPGFLDARERHVRQAARRARSADPARARVHRARPRALDGRRAAGADRGRGGAAGHGRRAPAERAASQPAALHARAQRAGRVHRRAGFATAARARGGRVVESLSGASAGAPPERRWGASQRSRRWSSSSAGQLMSARSPLGSVSSPSSWPAVHVLW